jgi:hypothetical protein
MGGIASLVIRYMTSQNYVIFLGDATGEPTTPHTVKKDSHDRYIIQRLKRSLSPSQTP